MPDIGPITDSYIDSIIKANGSSNSDPDKTQGVGLRELIKLMRDRFEQEIAALSNGEFVPYTGATTDISLNSHTILGYSGSNMTENQWIVGKNPRFGNITLTSDGLISGTPKSSITLNSGAANEKSLVYYPDFYIDNRLHFGTDALAYLSDIPSVTGFVPYTGATENVDIGIYNLSGHAITLIGIAPQLNIGATGGIYQAGMDNNGIGISRTSDGSYTKLSYNYLLFNGISGFEQYIQPTDGTITASSNFKLPAISGDHVFAMVDDLGSYLQLTGSGQTVNQAVDFTQAVGINAGLDVTAGGGSFNIAYSAKQNFIHDTTIYSQGDYFIELDVDGKLLFYRRGYNIIGGGIIPDGQIFFDGSDIEDGAGYKFIKNNGSSADVILGDGTYAPYGGGSGGDFVPYTGANQAIDVGGNNFTTAGNIYASYAQFGNLVVSSGGNGIQDSDGIHYIKGNGSSTDVILGDGTYAPYGGSGDFVPYSGATTDIDFNNKLIGNINTITAGTYYVSNELHLVNSAHLSYEDTSDGTQNWALLGGGGINGFTLSQQNANADPTQSFYFGMDHTTGMLYLGKQGSGAYNYPVIVGNGDPSNVILGDGTYAPYFGVVSSSTTNTVTNKIKVNIGGTDYYLLASTSAT